MLWATLAFLAGITVGQFVKFEIIKPIIVFARRNTKDGNKNK